MNALRALSFGPLETGTTTGDGKVSGHSAAALQNRGLVSRAPVVVGTTWMVTITAMGRRALREASR